VFDRQRSGERVYDLDADGVGHYWLYADLLADMQEQTGRAVLGPHFRSTEGYLRTWERAVNHRRT